jgi:hypothetical protein
MTIKETEIVDLIHWDSSWKTVFVKDKNEHMKVRSGVPTSKVF